MIPFRKLDGPTIAMDKKPHRIRLRGPWEVLSRNEAGEIVSRLGCMFPFTLKSIDWSSDASKCSFYRRFGRPTNLDPKDRVWLVIKALHDEVEVVVNAKSLGVAMWEGEFDITSLLEIRNSLELFFNPRPESGLSGDVYLEFRRSE